jgi:hypothetical protein
VRHENDVRLALRDQGAYRRFERVGIELRRRHLDRDDLIHAGELQRIDQRAGGGGEERYGHVIAVAAQALRGADELQRHGAQLAATLLRNHQDSAHAASPLSSRMISASLLACSAASPSMS